MCPDSLLELLVVSPSCVAVVAGRPVFVVSSNLCSPILPSRIILLMCAHVAVSAASVAAMDRTHVPVACEERNLGEWMQPGPDHSSPSSVMK